MTLPEPYYERDGITIYVGDNREVLPHIKPVHAVVTDPPYGLSFMGKGWDHQVPGVEFWQAIMAAMLPGAHLLAFGGTRTYHRMAVAIEDAGYEIRDTLQWLYGSGFPKSHDVSKAIDKMAGAEREVVGTRILKGTAAIDGRQGRAAASASGESGVGKSREVSITTPATPEAEQWQGWGTALKPAYEPIIMARLPFKGTVAQNVLAHGTGAINVDACRIGTNGGTTRSHQEPYGDGGRMDQGGSQPWRTGHAVNDIGKGRWPANVILDEAAAEALDAQSGERRSAGNYPTTYSNTEGYGGGIGKVQGQLYDDTGGASRYFKVVAQDCLSTYNVEEQECAPCGEESTEAGNTFAGKNTGSSEGNSHTAGCGSKPTVLFQTDTKSTTSTTTHSITSCPTCNSSPQNGTTTTTCDCGKITETLTALNTDAANGVTSTSRSTSSSDASPAPIRDTASLASANTSESGEQQTANITTNICAPIESESATHSRFFYCAKSSRRERNAGLPEGETSAHPTVKPLALMRYLIQMVTPPGGIVLDPFAGSGSTLVAAAELGFHAIGIELDPEYAEIAARRVDHALNERARRLPGLEALS